MTTGYHPNCVCFHYHKVPISGALFFVFAPESVEHVTDTCSLAIFFSHPLRFSLVDFDCKAAQNIL